jgi:phage repressor protein C with HTH and peptisase S24 domain
VAAALQYVDYLPVFSLEAACGKFGRGLAVEPQGWIKCPPGIKPDRNKFVARVTGRSMEPRIEDGDYCVFRLSVGGTRKDKVVLVQHSSIADPDTGASYTVKKYTSKINQAEDGTWQHEEIILKPLNPEYDDIVIRDAEDEEFVVVAEVVGKCPI